MANLDQLGLPNGSTYNFKDNTQERSNHRHYESDLIPLVSKTYASTSYYATTGSSHDSASWFFISVRPDGWYKPWKIKFKIRSFCPSYTNIDSITWATVSGRADDYTYADWNEHFDTGHYYIGLYRLKKAGYDAGYGHALGINIIWGTNYTNSAYYRTFELDYFECENCTVTVLDTPIHWASWTGGTTTNYYGQANLNAVDRGLMESGDSDSTGYYVRRIYSDIKAGPNKVFPYTIIMQIADGRWESIVSSASTGTKSRNTHGFRLGQMLLMYGSGTYNEDAYIDNYNVWSFYTGTVDHRYSFNTANDSTNGLIANKPVYLVGTLDSVGLFYLDSKWWTQTLPNSADGKLYIYLGDDFDYYRMIFDSNHPIYHYVNGAIREFTQDAGTVNGLSVQTAVPSGAKFTDTTYTLGTSGNNITLTPSSGSAQNVTVPYATKASGLATVGRQTDPNTQYGDGAVRYGIVSSSMTTDKPNNADGHLIYFPWDNNGGWDTQMYIQNEGAGILWIRGQSNHTWQAWKPVGVFSETPASGQIVVADGTAGKIKTSGYTIAKSVPSDAVFTDTKNTAGSTDTSSKIFLIGATSQAANPQTYSDNEVYATSGVLTTKSVQIGGGSATMQYNSATQAIDFIFT